MMRRAIARVVAMSLLAMPAAAQRAEPRGPAVTRGDAQLLAVAFAAAIGVSTLDQRISDALRTSSLHENAAVRSVMDGARIVGDPGSLIASVGLWAAGHARGDRTQELVGLRALESVVASGIVTGGIKGLVGRARPNVSPGNARSIGVLRRLRDGSDYQSFPSGHTTAAFAFASAVDAEWGRLSPGRPRWVAPALYGVAALTGISRVFHDRHWTSDVVMGGAIGYLTGRAIARWHADARQAP